MRAGSSSPESTEWDSAARIGAAADSIKSRTSDKLVFTELILAAVFDLFSTSIVDFWIICSVSFKNISNLRRCTLIASSPTGTTAAPARDLASSSSLREMASVRILLYSLSSSASEISISVLIPRPNLTNSPTVIFFLICGECKSVFSIITANDST